MPAWFQLTLLTSYLIPTTVLMVFAINLYVLVGLFLRQTRTVRAEVDAINREWEQRFTDADLPSVTTQLPIYNEFNVIERCIRACAAMDYPAEKHTIQILDDSNDETSPLVDRIADELRRGGARIEVIRRDTRVGYKAGALTEGMHRTEDDFFAIFDADFVPPPDFLRRTMQVMMVRQDIGLVQARWGHLNEFENLLTRTQGMGIDGHFTVEQPARAWNELVMNFNGTAGLWRREAINDAGGWEHDTLTEDLDLSYRSQLIGWKPFYLLDLVVPAEIPGDINAFKSQQFRWAKGSIETARKLLPTVMRSNVPPLVKLESIFHMTHYLVHPIMLWLAVMSYPILKLPLLQDYRFEFSPFVYLVIISTLAPTVMYTISQCHLHKRPWRKLMLLPFLSVLGIGIAISNTRAVLQALRGKKSGFVRTPKAGERSVVNYHFRMPKLALAEIAVGFYCLCTTISYVQSGRLFLVPFILLYALGFLWVGSLSVAHHLKSCRDA